MGWVTQNELKWNFYFFLRGGSVKVIFNSFFSPNCKKSILDIDTFSCIEGGSPLWAFQVPPLDSIDNYYKLTKPYQGHHCMCRDQHVASDIVHVVAKSVF